MIELKPLSRQRKWQLKMKALGKCLICGKVAITREHCERHRIIACVRTAKRQRKHIRMGLCPCGRKRDNETTKCNLCREGCKKSYIKKIELYRAKSREYAREKYGYSAWRVGSRGRPPIARKENSA